MASFVVGLGISPSEYRSLSLREHRALIETANRRD